MAVHKIWEDMPIDKHKHEVASCELAVLLASWDCKLQKPCPAWSKDGVRMEPVAKGAYDASSILVPFRRLLAA